MFVWTELSQLRGAREQGEQRTGALCRQAGPQTKGRRWVCWLVFSHIRKVTSTPPWKRIYEVDGEKPGVLPQNLSSHESKHQGWKINVTSFTHSLPPTPTLSFSLLFSQLTEVNTKACGMNEGMNCSPGQSYYHICKSTPRIPTLLLKVTPLGIPRETQHRCVPDEPLQGD